MFLISKPFFQIFIDKTNDVRKPFIETYPIIAHALRITLFEFKAKWQPGVIENKFEFQLSIQLDATSISRIYEKGIDNTPYNEHLEFEINFPIWKNELSNKEISVYLFRGRPQLMLGNHWIPFEFNVGDLYSLLQKDLKHQIVFEATLTTQDMRFDNLLKPFGNAFNSVYIVALVAKFCFFLFFFFN